MDPLVILGHGIGGRGDLPLPVGALVVGACAALVISFVVLLAAWPHPRLHRWARVRPLCSLPARVTSVLSAFGRVIGGLVVLTTVVSLLLVDDNPIENIAPRLIYVFLWVVVPLASVVVGDLWRWLSPFEAIAALRDRRVAARSPVPPSTTSLVPAAVALALFHWIELSFHDPAGRSVLRVLVAGWVVAGVTAAWQGGTERLRRRDPLAVWCSLLASMSPVVVRDGRIGWRVPGSGLAEVGRPAGLTLVVAVVLGGTTFDGVSRTQQWAELLGTRTGWSATLVNTIGLALCTAGVVALYTGAVVAMERMTGRSVAGTADRLAVALVPVAVGYSLAHYFSLAVFEGQFLVIQASDPFARGWDLFGWRASYPSYTAVSTTTIAVVQAAGVVLGHLIGVVVGHDLALRDLEGRHFRRGQLPLLGAMMVFTSLGLWLLVSA